MGKIFEYPWHELEQYLEEQSEGTLYLLGYGSLLNAYSSGVTLKESNRLSPAIGSGFKRVFNYPLEQSAYERYGPPHLPLYNAALNAVPEEDMDIALNGLIQKIPLSDLDNLRNRELQYRLREIECVDWETREPIPQKVFILTYPWEEQEMYPHSQYLEVCLEGARSISTEFEEVFLRTTYLFDKKTTLEDWLLQNQFA